MSNNSNINLDNLNVNSYNLTVDKLPYFNYKLKEFQMPSFSTSHIEVPNPLQPLKVYGDKLNYSELSATFIVDEDAYNYQSVYQWMAGIAFPDTMQQFRDIAKGSYDITPRRNSYAQNLTSDITLHLLTNSRNSNRIVRYYNAFPISLSGFTLMNSNMDSEVLLATVEFAYTGMQFNFKGD